MNKSIDNIENIMKSDSKIVVLTGVRVSAESGISTFRGNNGLWRKYNPQELATPVVYPAAYLPRIAKENGAYLIEINLERTPVTNYADLYLNKSASEGLEIITKEIL